MAAAVVVSGSTCSIVKVHDDVGGGHEHDHRRYRRRIPIHDV